MMFHLFRVPLKTTFSTKISVGDTLNSHLFYSHCLLCNLLTTIMMAETPQGEEINWFIFYRMYMSFLVLNSSGSSTSQRCGLLIMKKVSKQGGGVSQKVSKFFTF